MHYSSYVPWIAFEEFEFYACMKNQNIKNTRFEHCFFGENDSYGHILLMCLSVFWFVVRRDFEQTSSNTLSRMDDVPCVDTVEANGTHIQNNPSQPPMNDNEVMKRCKQIHTIESHEILFRPSYRLRNRQVMCAIHR